MTKKNSQQIRYKGTHCPTCGKGKHPFPAPSAAFERYQAAALWYLKPAPPTPIDKPCNVKTLFYMPTHRRVDLPNLQEAILDVLVVAGVLSDDNANIVVSQDGSRVLYDKDNPRTEIEITLYQ